MSRNFFEEIYNVGFQSVYEVQKTETGSKMAIELPGVAKEDLNLTVENGDVKISYKKKMLDKESEGEYFVNKKHLTSYDLTKISASLKDGILVLEFVNKENLKQVITVN